jgi:predicted DCC family thiol-disulfide oxidoreductase YuxK
MANPERAETRAQARAETAGNPEENAAAAVVLFDGVCVLCNGSVRFIAKRDPAGYYRFAALESPAGGALLERYGVRHVSADTFVLIEDGRVYFRSDSGLRIARRLGFPWSWLYPLVWLPRWLRDPVYSLVAVNRYRLFGKLDACPVPSPELRRRFL